MEKPHISKPPRFLWNFAFTYLFHFSHSPLVFWCIFWRINPFLDNEISINLCPFLGLNAQMLVKVANLFFISLAIYLCGTFRFQGVYKFPDDQPPPPPPPHSPHPSGILFRFRLMWIPGLWLRLRLQFDVLWHDSAVAGPTSAWPRGTVHVLRVWQTL